MNIPKPYFKDIPIYGDLEMYNIIIEDVYPVLFILINTNNELFISVCCDIRYEQRWIINPVTIKQIIGLLKNEITIHDIFIYGNCQKIIVTRDYKTTLETSKLVEINDINTNDLPTQGYYIDAEDGEYDSLISSISKLQKLTQEESCIYSLHRTFTVTNLKYSINPTTLIMKELFYGNNSFKQTHFQPSLNGVKCHV